MTAARVEEHHRDVRLALAQPGVGAVEVAAGQAPGQQREVDGGHVAVEAELGHHRVPVTHHRHDRPHQVRGEPVREVLRRHLPAAPLQPVQLQQPVQRRVDPVRRHDRTLHAERVQLAELGAHALRLAGGEAGDQPCHGGGGQLQAERVLQAPAGAAPEVVDLFDGTAGPHLAEVDHRGAGGGGQALGERGGGGVGVLVVEQDVGVVREGAAERHEGGHGPAHPRQRGDGTQLAPVPHDDEPQPAAAPVRQPPGVRPGVTLERRRTLAPPVQPPPRGRERGERLGVPHDVDDEPAPAGSRGRPRGRGPGRRTGSDGGRGGPRPDFRGGLGGRRARRQGRRVRRHGRRGGLRAGLSGGFGVRRVGCGFGRGPGSGVRLGLGTGLRSGPGVGLGPRPGLPP